MPVGTTCTLSETTKPATTGPSYVNGDEVFTPSNTVVIGSTETVSVTLTNPIERRFGGLTVTKNVTGATAGYVEGSTFGFTLDSAGTDSTVVLARGRRHQGRRRHPPRHPVHGQRGQCAGAVEGYEYQTPVLTPANGTVTITSRAGHGHRREPLVYPGPRRHRRRLKRWRRRHLRKTGGGDVVYQIVVDGEDFGRRTP